MIACGATSSPRSRPDNPKLQQLVADLSQLGETRASTAVRRPSRMSVAMGKPKAGDLIFLDVGDDEEEKKAPAAPPKPAPPIAKPAAPAPKPAPKPAPPPPEPEPEPEPLAIERPSLMDDDAMPALGDADLSIETSALDGLMVDGMDLGAAPDADLPDLEVHEELPDLTSIDMPDEIIPADISLNEAEIPVELSLEADAPILRATGGHEAFTGNTFEPEAVEEPTIELEAGLEAGLEAEIEEPLAFIEAEAPRQLSTAELEERIIDDPENPEHHRSLGEALLAAGESQRGHEELELALDRYEAKEEWPKALDITNELISLDTTAVRFYQKRVELAFRLGDREYLVDSYLELGDSLLRSGAVDKAVAVYRRVAEHDPGNQRAATALLTLAGEEAAPPAPPKAAPAKPAPAKPAPPAAGEPRAPRASRAVPVASDGFVDLGSFIMDDDATVPAQLTCMRDNRSAL